MSPRDETQPTSAIVAVGASAGGVEALSEFLASFPATPGLALLVVKHRDPAHAGLIVEILSKISSMPVAELQDGMAFAANQVYVVPASSTVAAIDAGVSLHRHDTLQQQRMPIDSMFSALAAQRERPKIGVVLSGTGSDGALGIQEVKDAGGITFAQEPSSARCDGMPKKAIETGCVDFILTPQAIAEKILEVHQHPYLNETPLAAESPASDENSLRKIFRLLRTQTRADFSQYKSNTIQRRLARRMALRKVEGLAEYAELVQDDRDEVEALVQGFLIRVTGFFRHPETFQGLTESVFSKLLENRPAIEPLRIWVPGCATGEEVYSIAIILTEFLAGRSSVAPIQIFGTDLSETAIRQARAGEYLSNIEYEVSSERLQRFFVKLNDHYQIAKSLRELCIFARHNLTYDPPFSRIDLVCCRNVLIYFDQNMQQRVIRSFHYPLKPGGFLALGPSESVNQIPELFQLADSRHRIYRKQNVPGLLEGEADSVVPRASRAPISPPTAPLPLPAPNSQRAQHEIERLLLARYAPATVLIDDDPNVIYFQGETAPYLEHVRGSARLNLEKIVRPQLLMEVSSEIKQAREKGAPVRRERVHFELGEAALAVNLEVVPVKLPGAEANLSCACRLSDLPRHRQNHWPTKRLSRR